MIVSSCGGAVHLSIRAPLTLTMTTNNRFIPQTPATDDCFSLCVLIIIPFVAIDNTSTFGQSKPRLYRDCFANAVVTHTVREKAFLNILVCVPSHKPLRVVRIMRCCPPTGALIEMYDTICPLLTSSWGWSQALIWISFQDAKHIRDAIYVSIHWCDPEASAVWFACVKKADVFSAIETTWWLNVTQCLM